MPRRRPLKLDRSGLDVLSIVPASSPAPATPIQGMAIASSRLKAAFKPRPGTKATRAVSPSPDFPTFHTVGGKSYIINHFENPQPSTMYISEVAGPDASGNVRITSTKPIPDAQVLGTWHVRSASKTPWNTHLASEEYPPDCRSYDEFFVPCKAGPEAVRTFCGLAASEMDATSIGEMARYFGYYANGAKDGLGEVDILNNQKAHDDFVKLFKCYNYGASPEVTVLPGGSTRLTKWRTLGRVSHENSIVMPDNRTVYMSDDHPNGVFTRFVADRPSDLSSGTLFAMKLTMQRSDAQGRPVWDVSWVELGRGSQTQLDKMALSGMKFTDIFEVAQPRGSPPKCPAGFSMTNHPSLIYKVTDPSTFATYHMECLKVKPGMDTAAAFFEPRRLAAMKGATAEFEKQDGLTWSSRFKQLYFADSRIAKGMTDDAQFNYASLNAIRLRANPCGALFSIDLDDNWSGTMAKLLLGGEALQSVTPSAAPKCSPNNVADPERTEYVAGNLLIQEGSAARGESVMWAYNLEDGSLTRIFTGPTGSELTGVGANRIGDRAYVTFAMQQGTGSTPGRMGYLGPLPADIMTDKFTMKFERPAPTPGGAAGGAASKSVCIAPAKAMAKPAGQR
ncbi:MAG: hypothetical protein J3K34DRAFT_162339 [Monoraphidium minutum]|nr:MAG: hypothetical protein J3K34DRAFT_162339 [Monoraphidium minutum]